MVTPKYHVFICTSCRLNGEQKGFCHQKYSVNLVKSLMENIDEHHLSGDVTVTNTGCFGICARGPVMVVYPEGIWYGNLTEADIETIVEEHFEGGKAVEALRI